MKQPSIVKRLGRQYCVYNMEVIVNPEDGERKHTVFREDYGNMWEISRCDPVFCVGGAERERDRETERETERDRDRDRDRDRERSDREK